MALALLKKGMKAANAGKIVAPPKQDKPHKTRVDKKPERQKALPVPHAQKPLPVTVMASPCLFLKCLQTACADCGGASPLPMQPLGFASLM